MTLIPSRGKSTNRVNIGGKIFSCAPYTVVRNQLLLPKDYMPSTVVGKMFGDITTSELIYALKLSNDEEAMRVVERYEALPTNCKTRIENPGGIDWVLAAVVSDACKIAGLLLEYVMRTRGMEAHARLAMAAPRVADAMIDRSLITNSGIGHQDGRLIMQTLGVSPVPKNQVTNMTINNSRLTQVNAVNQVPRLEDITRAVEAAQQKGLKAVPLLDCDVSS